MDTTVTRVESESSTVLCDDAFVDPSFESTFAFLLSAVAACVMTWPHVTHFVKLGLKNTAASHWLAGFLYCFSVVFWSFGGGCGRLLPTVATTV